METERRHGTVKTKDDAFHSRLLQQQLCLAGPPISAVVSPFPSVFRGARPRRISHSTARSRLGSLTSHQGDTSNNGTAGNIETDFISSLPHQSCHALDTLQHLTVSNRDKMSTPRFQCQYFYVDVNTSTYSTKEPYI